MFIKKINSQIFSCVNANKNLSILGFRIVLIFFIFSIAQTRCYAQENAMEEIIVESQESGIQVLDDLVSVSTLDAEKLADANIENIEDVAAYVPNLVLTETETGTNIVIRGIGAGVNQGFDQSVGLFSDGVPLPRSNMARAPFLDLSSVQIKRGPQYVQDGNYAIAGSVHMISNLSIDEFKASVDFNYAPSENDKTLLLTLGGPITDSFAANVVVQTKQSDGYVRNVFKQQNEKQKDEFLGRLVLGFTPTENLSFKLKVESGTFDTIGKNAEIILDNIIPKPNIRAARTGFNAQTRNAADQNVAAPWLSDFDFIYRPLNVDYDIALNQNAPQNLNQFDNDTRKLRESYWGAGYNYTGKIAEQYLIAGAALPAGLNDTSLDYRRSTDAEESSTNDSNNITLSTKLWMGEHQLTLITSYVDYDFKELQDLDFTSANLFAGQQSESYSQTFSSLNYKSEKGNFLEVEAGLWYLNSELVSNNFIFVPFAPRTYPDGSPIIKFEDDVNQPNFSADLLLNFFEDPSLQSIPDAARAYYGTRASGEKTVLALTNYGFDTEFEQNQELYSVYLQGKLNWSEALRTIIGARYTRSEKTSIRDSALKSTSDGQLINNDDLLAGSDSLNLVTNTIISFAGEFGLQSHSCRYEEGVDLSTLGVKNAAAGCLRGTRVDEDLYPSITIEADMTHNFSLLLSARMAGKLGGFDAQSVTRPDSVRGIGLPIGTFEFRDEKALTYEIGFKWFLPDGLGEMKTTAFYTDYTDLQLSRSDGKSGFLVDNAGAATNHGVEVEGNLLLSDRLSIDYSIAYTQFEFKDFKFGNCHLGRQADNYFVTEDVMEQGENATVTTNFFLQFDGQVPQEGFIPINYDVFRFQPGSGTPGLGGSGDAPAYSNFTTAPDGSKKQQGASYLNPRGLEGFENRTFLTAFCDFKGQTNQYVADWEGRISLNYENQIANLGVLSPTLDILYNSGYHTTSSQDPLAFQNAFIQLNGRLALTSFDEIWVVALTGQNLTNEKIVTYANDTPIGSRFQGARGFIGFTRPPRSIGINVRYKFY